MYGLISIVLFHTAISLTEGGYVCMIGTKNSEFAFDFVEKEFHVCRC